MNPQARSATDSRQPFDAEPTDIAPDRMAAILALNNLHQTELSWLDAGQLRRLVAQCFSARSIGAAQAFMLAFDERAADYDSPNYHWFRARFPRFVYVDRLVVDPDHRGRGHARRLYADLIDRATTARHDLIVCEVNSDPPNPASAALHASLGFSEVGRALIRSGTKQVRYLARPVAPPAPMPKATPDEPTTPAGGTAPTGPAPASPAPAPACRPTGRRT